MKEIERRKTDALREEKLIQRIREDSEELRELEAKLKAAYVAKERAAQIEESRTRRVLSKQEQIELDNKMLEHAERAVDIESQRDRERLERNLAGKQVHTDCSFLRSQRLTSVSPFFFRCFCFLVSADVGGTDCGARAAARACIYGA